MGFSTIIAAIAAIPKIKAWFDELVAFYVATKIASMKRENREAIRKAMLEQDQRDLEGATGHPNPGEPSNEDGTEIITTPPPGA